MKVTIKTDIAKATSAGGTRIPRAVQFSPVVRSDGVINESAVMAAASDSRILAVVPCEAENAMRSSLLPAQLLGLGRKGQPDVATLVSGIVGPEWSVRNKKGNYVGLPPIDSRFPRWDQIIGAVRAETALAITFDPALLLRLAQSITPRGAEDQTVTLFIDPDFPTSPVANSGFIGVIGYGDGAGIGCFMSCEMKEHLSATRERFRQIQDIKVVR